MGATALGAVARRMCPVGTGPCHLCVAADEFRAALDCRRALLLAAMLGGAGASLQAEWQSLADEYIIHNAPLAAARTQLQPIEHLTMLVRNWLPAMVYWRMLSSGTMICSTMKLLVLG